MNNQAKPVDGARSVYRALQLLDLVAHHHEDGIGLAELVTLTGLDRTTVYRLASTLERENLLERDTDSRRYHLGMESMQIGLTTMSRAPILDDCVPAMKAIAQESEDIVFLVVRNGDYAHCLHLEEGAFPIRTVTQHVGACACWDWARRDKRCWRRCRTRRSMPSSTGIGWNMKRAACPANS